MIWLIEEFLHSGDLQIHWHAAFRLFSSWYFLSKRLTARSYKSVLLIYQLKHFSWQPMLSESSSKVCQMLFILSGDFQSIIRNYNALTIGIFMYFPPFLWIFHCPFPGIFREFDLLSTGSLGESWSIFMDQSLIKHLNLELKAIWNSLKPSIKQKKEVSFAWSMLKLENSKFRVQHHSRQVQMGTFEAVWYFFHYFW